MLGMWRASQITDGLGAATAPTRARASQIAGQTTSRHSASSTFNAFYKYNERRL